jgi:hypothetical protein
MLIKQCLSYFLIFTMIANSCRFAVTAAVTGASIFYTNDVWANTTPTSTPLLDKLNQKYGLQDPTRNHQTDVLSNKVQNQITNPGASRDLTPQIVNTLNNSGPSTTVDLSKYGSAAAPTFNQYRDQAVNLSKTQGMPTGTVSSTANGDSIQSVDAQYARGGTRQVTRDANGQLVIKVIENVDRASGLDANDLLSSENNPTHPGYSYEAGKKTMYGNETAIFDQGKLTHQTFKAPSTGNSASARSYRAITAGAYRAAMEPSPLLMLQQSFDKLEDTQDPTKFLTGCTTQTIPSNAQFTSTSASEYFCQDTGKSNLDYCEVERKTKIPVYSSSPGLRTCGVGCYEFPLNIDVWKTSSCRSTPGHAPSAQFTLNLNLSHGIAIKSVSITGEADDHFRYTLNGQKLWESNGGSQSTSGNMDGGACNPDGFHKINTDITSRVTSILGSLPATGVATLNFQGDIRWKRNGGMTSTIRFEIEDTSGEGLETEFIQTPEGCYDALKLEDKITRGLNGIYDWQELGIDPSLPPHIYQCKSPPRQASCPAGETAFGSAGQEKCYAIPKPPVCPAGTFNAATNRCEYGATIKCPTLSGVSCGTNASGNPIYPIDPESTLIGLRCHYQDHEHCGPWNYEQDATISCPNGGTVDGTLCVMPGITTNVCDTAKGYSLKTVKMDGVEYQRCEGPVTDYQPNVWTCDAPHQFESNYCTITYEDFKDENGVPIPTIDANGNPINPPYYDSEGQLIEFEDVAKCWKPQSVPGADPIDIPKSFCTFDEYEVMEEGSRGFPIDLLVAVPPFFTGDTGNKTWKVNLKKYRCDPTDGRIMCYPDPDTGKEVCYNWEDLKNLPDRCLRYKQEPKCREVARECTEGWYEPITKRCMADTVTYRCEEESVIDYQTKIEKNTCESMMPCVGGNCEIGQPEKNDKFVKAMVAGSILDNVQGDSSCKDPSDPSTCRIFEGEYKYCSWETSGLGSDCCEEAKGVDILGYITFTRQMLKVNQMAYSGGFGQGVAGGYQKLAQPVTDGYKAIADWANSQIRSASESIFGNTQAASQGVTAASNGITAALAQLQQQVYKFVYDMLPDALQTLVFDVVKDKATGEVTDIALDKAFGNALSNVMAVYTAYQLIKLALILLTACDKHEMDMGVRLAQKQCFKVGNTYCNKKYPIGTCMQRRQDHCCYSSILARIVMKEAYTQLNINPLPFGNQLKAETPEAEGSCLGLTSEQLGMVNFDAPSMQTALNEWIGLLLKAGEIPSESSEQSLTGGATADATTCPPQEKPRLFCYIDTNTGEQICEHARDANGNLLYDSVPTDCVKKLKPGQIWNASDRKPATERITGSDGYIKNAQDRVMESKNQIKTILNNLDCSVVPRPPVCQFGIDPKGN